jgi:hypothetical protein
VSLDNAFVLIEGHPTKEKALADREGLFDFGLIVSELG